MINGGNIIERLSDEEVRTRKISVTNLVSRVDFKGELFSCIVQEAVR
jgi:hypothetical protein